MNSIQSKLDPLWTLLFPYSLSNEELKQSLFKVRNSIFISDFRTRFLQFFQMGFGVKSQDRDELLEFFVKNVMPKPQRDIYKSAKRKSDKPSETENGTKRKLEELTQSEETNSDSSAKKKFKAKSRISFP